MTVVVVRHGETEWSRARRHTGRTDIALLPDGEAGARRLAPALAAWSFDAVYSSPLQRAWRTCELAGFGDRAVADDDLMEWDYGTAEGRTTADIRVERPHWSVWWEGPDGGESITDVAHRADRFITRALTHDGDVLVFAHGHLLRVLAARWCEMDPRAGQRFRLDPTTIGELGWEHDARVLLRWNGPPP
jgi:probable phosphoglycerate mutase